MRATPTPSCLDYELVLDTIVAEQRVQLSSLEICDQKKEGVLCLNNWPYPK